MYNVKQTLLVWGLKQNESNSVATKAPAGLSVISKSQKTAKNLWKQILKLLLQDWKKKKNNYKISTHTISPPPKQTHSFDNSSLA